VSDQPPTPLNVSEMQQRALAELRRISVVTDELGDRFAAAGEHIALVGGPVRDAMLGRQQFDLDFTTSARPGTTERLLEGWAEATWDMGRAFGTIGCRKGDWQVEITTYRSDAYDAASRKPSVDFGDSLRGDLGRRDFTINAMALTMPGNEFEDPYDGVVDLALGVLRTPGRPEDSFSDDPLRMMRAARFAAQLGFTVDPTVVEAMTAMAARIGIVSAERVRDELVKLVCAADPRRGLTLLVETGLAGHVLPELPALALERDEHHRHKDVYQHTLTVLSSRSSSRPGCREVVRTSSPGSPPSCTTWASPGPDVSRTTAPSPSTTMTWWAPRSPGNGCRRCGSATTTSTPCRTSWSYTCASTATGRAGGPTPPCGATSAMPAASSSGCTC